MRMTRLSRSLALVAAAALLATMTAATVASPASAAKPKCQGKVATIVGTQKADIIRGTAKRDVIVAKGGADRIYGYRPEDVWIVRRRDFRMIRDPFSKAEQGVTRFILEGRFGVHFPIPNTAQIATVLTP